MDSGGEQLGWNRHRISPNRPRGGRRPAGARRVDEHGTSRTRRGAEVGVALRWPAGGFQILLLELSGATLLLLDEPTDNLDVQSAEALEAGLDAFDGTVVAVTHDRWFARDLDRYLVFGEDGLVYEANEPIGMQGACADLARPT